MITTLSTPLSAPVIAATRLRAGNAGSARGAATMISEAITTARACGAGGDIVVRADSAFYAKTVITTCLIAGPLAHLPSGRFSANDAWLTCAAITHNLTRTAGHLAAGTHHTARPATIRTRIVTVAARLAHRARTIHLHLPEHWPWQAGFDNLFTAVKTTPG